MFSKLVPVPLLYSARWMNKEEREVIVEDNDENLELESELENIKKSFTEFIYGLLPIRIFLNRRDTVIDGVLEEDKAEFCSGLLVAFGFQKDSSRRRKTRLTILWKNKYYTQCMVSDMWTYTVRKILNPDAEPNSFETDAYTQLMFEDVQGTNFVLQMIGTVHELKVLFPKELRDSRENLGKTVNKIVGSIQNSRSLRPKTKFDRLYEIVDEVSRFRFPYAYSYVPFVLYRLLLVAYNTKPRRYSTFEKA